MLDVSGHLTGKSTVMLPEAAPIQFGYSTGMDMQGILDRVSERLKEIGASERSAALAAGMSEDGIRNWRRRLSRGEKPSMSAVNLWSLAEFLSVPVEWLVSGGDREPTVAVAGRVGAGDTVPLEDVYAKGDGLYHVARPEGFAGRSVVAVEIEGESMLPVYGPGDVVFYSREAYGVPTECLGRICVCECEEGNGWLKVVLPGTQPGRFHLRSLNSRVPLMEDVPLRWAAKVLNYREASASGRAR